MKKKLLLPTCPPGLPSSCHLNRRAPLLPVGGRPANHLFSSPESPSCPPTHRRVSFRSFCSHTQRTAGWQGICNVAIFAVSICFPHPAGASSAGGPPWGGTGQPAAQMTPPLSWALAQVQQRVGSGGGSWVLSVCHPSQMHCTAFLCMSVSFLKPCQALAFHFVVTAAKVFVDMAEDSPSSKQSNLPPQHSERNDNLIWFGKLAVGVGSRYPQVGEAGFW